VNQRLRSSVLVFGAMLLTLHCSKPESAPRKPVSVSTGRCMSLGDFMGKVNERSQAVAGERKIRLAVIPLKGTDSQRWGDKGFGTYVTEKISSTLGAPNSPIRLFERSRLDAVLQEQKLSASGLFNESEARKIGELAPIDDILTGTFTRLDSCVSINLRIIDVVSGEVRGNLSENVDLTADLASLFEDLQAIPTDAPTPVVGTTPSTPMRGASPCEPRWEPVRKLMNDIGTQEKLDRMLDAALAFPFEGPCGNIHFEVISLLMRYKRYPPRYGQFLLETLRKIDDPDLDDRDREIGRYLLMPGQLEDPAWEAMLRLSGRSKRFNGYLEMLLADKIGTTESRSRLQARIGIILDRAGRKQLGRPVPIESTWAFTEIMSTLRHDFLGSFAKTKDVRPLLDCYRVYGPRYAVDSDKRMLGVLLELQKSCAPGRDRDLAQDWAMDRINHFKPSRDLEDELVPFQERLLNERTSALKKDLSGGLPALELKRLATTCGDRIAQTIPFIMGRDYTLNAKGICLEFGIRAEGIVPTLADLTKQLSSEDETEKTEAIRLLKSLGPGAISAEPIVLKQLRRSEHGNEWDSRNKYLQHDLLELLGTMQTRNPESIQVLLRYLKDIESYVADVVIEALARIGEPAVPALKAEFPRIEEPYKQIRVIQVFQRRGKAARPHLPWLKARLAEAKSPHVKDALEDAIDAIS